MKRKSLRPDAVIRLDTMALDKRVTAVHPSAMLLVDARRRMVCLRFRETKDVYDLTEFRLSDDCMSVTCTWADYTQLLFWVREEHNGILLRQGKEPSP